MKHLEKQVLQIKIVEKISSSHFQVEMNILEESRDPGIPLDLKTHDSQQSKTQMNCDELTLKPQPVVTSEDLTREINPTCVAFEEVGAGTDGDKQGEDIAEFEVGDIDEDDGDYLQVEVVTCVSPSEIYVRTKEQVPKRQKR
jgi:hypothetical protein